MGKVIKYESVLVEALDSAGAGIESRQDNYTAEEIARIVNSFIYREEVEEVAIVFGYPLRGGKYKTSKELSVEEIIEMGLGEPKLTK